MHNKVYGLRANLILAPKFTRPNSSRSIEPPNFNDLRFGKLRSAMGMAFGLTTLFTAVRHIIQVSAQEQMRRITAAWDIATMTNQDIFIERPIHKLVAYSMGTLSFPTPVKAAISRNQRRRPQPTFVRPFDINFAPKTFLNSHKEIVS